MNKKVSLILGVIFLPIGIYLLGEVMGYKNPIPGMLDALDAGWARRRWIMPFIMIPAAIIAFSGMVYGITRRRR